MLIGFVLWSSFHFYSSTFLCSTKAKIPIRVRTTMCKLNYKQRCVRNAFFKVMLTSLSFGKKWTATRELRLLSLIVYSGSCSLVENCIDSLYVFTGGKQSALQQRLARTSCFHLHFKALLTPPCRTFTPRYQFCVITFLLSFWRIGPSWSFAVCSSYLCLLWLNTLQASTAL